MDMYYLHNFVMSSLSDNACNHGMFFSYSVFVFFLKFMSISLWTWYHYKINTIFRLMTIMHHYTQANDLLIEKI